MLGDAARFDRLTGQRTQVGHVIVGWGQGATWGSPLSWFFDHYAPTPMLGFSSAVFNREQVTPLDIARGAGDAYLVAMNAAVGVWGRPVYVRPLGEMNGHWNPYCAYTTSGRAKGATHSTAAFRKAFARIYLILHGGPSVQVNARLARLGLPPVAAALATNPFPILKVIWNPQGYGSPDVPGNRAQRYYPGDAFVDVVGDDLYDIRGKAEWAAAEALYRAHPRKPFAFAEWGLWGIDDPAFVRAMAGFVRSHPRTELVAYFNAGAGSTWDLASKPRSRAAYRALIVPLGAG